MRRFRIPHLILAVVLLLPAVLVSHPRNSIAQATPDTMTGHPLVGAWLVADASDPNKLTAINQYGVDGNALFNGDDGHIDQGTWHATGERSARLTVVGFIQDDSGTVVGLDTLSGTVEVDASGDTFQGHAVIVATTFDGYVLDQFEVDVIGIRIPVLEAGIPINAQPQATPQG